MTIATAISKARGYARVPSTWTTGSGVADDDHIELLIQEAVDDFTRDVGGFPETAYPQVDEKFSTRTYFGIHLAVTGGTYDGTDQDVAITGDDRDGATGTQVASDLQAALRDALGGTDVAVSWADFAFTIVITGATSFTISEPTGVGYADATGLLGLSGTEDDSSMTGDFPEGCTREYTLPTDCFHVERVEWDGNEVFPVPKEYGQHRETSGTPRYFYIRDRVLHFIPAPDEQGLCEVWYRGAPAAIDFDTDTDLPSEIPSNYHSGIVWLVASKLCLEQFDDKLAGLRFGQYMKMVSRYRVTRLANDTAVDDNRSWRAARYTVSM